MTNKKTLGFAALIALFVTVVGGFVVYAALSQRLDIEGSADFVPESWKVSFIDTSLSAPALTNGASVDGTPTLTDTMLSDYKVILTREGSSVTYTFDIKNSGSLDAKLTTLSLGDPQCTSEAETSALDIAIVCGSNLTYTLKYVGGQLSENGLTAGNNVEEEDLLKSNTLVTVALKLEFSSNANQLPTNPVAIDNLDSYIIYSAQ